MRSKEGAERWPDPACLRGLRVLVVEDEAAIAMAYEALLEDHGCDVLGPAARVEEALALIRAAAPEAAAPEAAAPEAAAPGAAAPGAAAPEAAAGLDAALLDVNLCGEPSTPVAEALAARGIPFLVVTGYTELAEALTGPIRSAPRLLKPVDPRELIRGLAALAC